MKKQRPSRSGNCHDEQNGTIPSPGKLTPQQAAFAQVLGRLLANRWQREVSQTHRPTCDSPIISTEGTA